MANILKENQTKENSHYNSHSDTKNKELSNFFTKLQTAYSSLANSKKINFDKIIDQYNASSSATISKEPKANEVFKDKVIDTTPNYYSFFDESQLKKQKNNGAEIEKENNVENQLKNADRDIEINLISYSNIGTNNQIFEFNDISHSLNILSPKGLNENMMSNNSIMKHDLLINGDIDINLKDELNKEEDINLSIEINHFDFYDARNEDTILKDTTLNLITKQNLPKIPLNKKNVNFKTIEHTKKSPIGKAPISNLNTSSIKSRINTTPLNFKSKSPIRNETAIKKIVSVTDKKATNLKSPIATKTITRPKSPYIPATPNRSPNKLDKSHSSGILNKTSSFNHNTNSKKQFNLSQLSENNNLLKDLEDIFGQNLENFDENCK